MKNPMLYMGILLPMHAAFGAASTCSISGTAYDAAGNPLRGVVRLVDRHTHQAEFRQTDGRAGFTFANLTADSSGGRYQLDVLSPPTVVTGTRIPTRSILGIAPRFVCAAGSTARADVRVQAE